MPRLVTSEAGTRRTSRPALSGRRGGYGARTGLCPSVRGRHATKGGRPIPVALDDVILDCLRFVASDDPPILNFGSRPGRILHGDPVQYETLKIACASPVGRGCAEADLLQTPVKRPLECSAEIGSAEELGHQKDRLAKDASLDLRRPGVSQGEIQNDAGDAFDIAGEGAIKDGATLNQHARDVFHVAGIDDGRPGAVPDHAVGRLRSGRGFAAQPCSGCRKWGRPFARRPTYGYRNERDGGDLGKGVEVVHRTPPAMARALGRVATCAVRRDVPVTPVTRSLRWTHRRPWQAIEARPRLNSCDGVRVRLRGLAGAGRLQRGIRLREGGTEKGMSQRPDSQVGHLTRR